MPESYSGAIPDGVRLLGLHRRENECEGAVECSTGTTSGREQYPGLRYIDTAFVPKLPWRRPSEDEFRTLRGDQSDIRPGRRIRVFDVEQSVFEAFEPLRSASIQSTAEQLKELALSKSLEHAVRRANHYAASLTSSASLMGRAALVIKPAGLPTITKYPELRGLHVDSTWRVPIGQRCHAATRLAINIGLDDRFFLYMTPDLSDIEGMLNSRRVVYTNDCEDERAPAHRFRASFMTAFSSVPVVKVRIRPGEAYIAPTESIIHDGCSEGQTTFDILFTVQGHFLG